MSPPPRRKRERLLRTLGTAGDIVVVAQAAASAKLYFLGAWALLGVLAARLAGQFAWWSAVPTWAQWMIAVSVALTILFTATLLFYVLKRLHAWLQPSMSFFGRSDGFTGFIEVYTTKPVEQVQIVAVGVPGLGVQSLVLRWDGASGTVLDLTPGIPRSARVADVEVVAPHPNPAAAPMEQWRLVFTLADGSTHTAPGHARPDRAGRRLNALWEFRIRVFVGAGGSPKLMAERDVRFSAYRDLGGPRAVHASLTVRQQEYAPPPDPSALSTDSWG